MLGLIDTMSVAGEALNGLAAFPNYLNASLPPDKRAQLESSIQQLAVFSEVREELKTASPEEKELLRSMLAGVGPGVADQLDAQLDQSLTEIVTTITDRLLNEGYPKLASALAKDLGVKLTAAELRDLASFLKDEAKETVRAVRTLQETKGSYSSLEVINASVEELKAGADILAKLQTELS
jgi:hypothetical protein